MLNEAVSMDFRIIPSFPKSTFKQVTVCSAESIYHIFILCPNTPITSRRKLLEFDLPQWSMVRSVTWYWNGLQFGRPLCHWTELKTGGKSRNSELNPAGRTQTLTDMAYGDCWEGEGRNVEKCRLKWNESCFRPQFCTVRLY